MLKAEHITKRFGARTAIHDLDFALNRGSACGLIGPNGAGKSTTIRMILGILEPDTGSIAFDGKPFPGNAQNLIGYLPEERGLYRTQKLNDVLLYLVALKGCPKSIAQPRIDGWLERFGLAEWKMKNISALSKGMAQKAQFIATIVHNPDIVILDEPFSGLDPVSADEMLAVIGELKNEGKLVLFSTHVMEQAEKACDHVIMLNAGEKILDGDLLAIRRDRGARAIKIEFVDTNDAITDGDFLAGISAVASFRDEGKGFLVTLTNGSTPDDILSAIAGKRSVRYFAVNEPSLHSIFVELAGEKDSPR